MSNTMLLVIEDDQNLSKLLEYNLGRAGFKCHLSSSGEDGLEQLSQKSFDLVLLDIMLPGISGFEVCRNIRQNQLHKDIPIIMLTAKGEEIDRVLGFELGVDDYVVKPFSPRELTLRIQAIINRERRKSGKVQELLKVAGLEIDLTRHIVTLDGKELILTLMEFKLLVALVKRKGEAQSREMLLSDVWNVDKTLNTRTIDTHITRIREKLGETGNMIKTLRGLGYKLEENEIAAHAE